MLNFTIPGVNTPSSNNINKNVGNIAIPSIPLFKPPTIPLINNNNNNNINNNSGTNNAKNNTSAIKSNLNNNPNPISIKSNCYIPSSGLGHYYTLLDSISSPQSAESLINQFTQLNIDSNPSKDFHYEILHGVVNLHQIFSKPLENQSSFDFSTPSPDELYRSNLSKPIIKSKTKKSKHNPEAIKLSLLNPESINGYVQWLKSVISKENFIVNKILNWLNNQNNAEHPFSFNSVARIPEIHNSHITFNASIYPHFYNSSLIHLLSIQENPRAANINLIHFCEQILFHIHLFIPQQLLYSSTASTTWLNHPRYRGSILSLLTNKSQSLLYLLIPQLYNSLSPETRKYVSIQHSLYNNHLVLFFSYLHLNSDSLAVEIYHEALMLAKLFNSIHSIIVLISDIHTINTQSEFVYSKSKFDSCNAFIMNKIIKPYGFNEKSIKIQFFPYNPKNCEHFVTESQNNTFQAIYNGKQTLLQLLQNPTDRSYILNNNNNNSNQLVSQIVSINDSNRRELEVNVLNGLLISDLPYKLISLTSNDKSLNLASKQCIQLRKFEQSMKPQYSDPQSILESKYPNNDNSKQHNKQYQYLNNIANNEGFVASTQWNDKINVICAGDSVKCKLMNCNENGVFTDEKQQDYNIGDLIVSVSEFAQPNIYRKIINTNQLKLQLYILPEAKFDVTSPLLALQFITPIALTKAETKEFIPQGLINVHITSVDSINTVNGVISVKRVVLADIMNEEFNIHSKFIQISVEIDNSCSSELIQLTLGQFIVLQNSKIIGAATRTN